MRRRDSLLILQRHRTLIDIGVSWLIDIWGSGGQGMVAYIQEDVHFASQIISMVVASIPGVCILCFVVFRSG